MMETTDMNDPMTVLKADHREVKRLLTALAESEEGPERERMAAEVETALTIHMELEERLVYPLVEGEVGEDDAEEANIEHGLARDGLAVMMSMVEKPGFGAAVEMLKGGIEHHVQEEESELLPELVASVSVAGGNESVGSVCAIAAEPTPKVRTAARLSEVRNLRI